MNQLFSIVIPTLGKIDQWSLTIRSVLRQSFGDFEIIAIDSGPEKDSMPIIKYFNDDRIKYVNTSLGDPRLNWDVGFRHASGKYIMWVDDDNYLLPHELHELASVIKETDADIVCGEHIHWRDLIYPVKSIRNQLIIPGHLFGGKIKKINHENVIRRILNIPQIGEPVRARFHHSEHAIKTDLIKKLVQKFGEISFGSTSTHALRLGSLALAKKVFFIDRPLAIVGQSGGSMSTVWPRDSSKIKHVAFEFRLSPVSAKTYTNYRHENHLLAKKYLPDELAAFPIDNYKFLEIYLRELVVLNQNWKNFFSKWAELLRAIKQNNDIRIRKLIRVFPAAFIKALVVKILRIFKIYSLLQTIFERYRKSGKNQVIISLDKYGVTDIEECAEKLPEIIEKELKTDYKKFLGLI